MLFRSHDKSGRLLLKRVALTFVVMTITYAYLHMDASEQSSTQGEEHKGAEQLNISLRAHTRQTKSEPIIHLQWDPSAEPIRHSAYGMLYIYGRITPRKIFLPREALRLGFRDYSPNTDEVTFHLVLDGGRSGEQSLLVLLGVMPSVAVER
jgi:hypothetical protein